MGCTQSKAAEVATAETTASVATKVELKTKELEHETEELPKQDEEPVDEAAKTLEPIPPVIDTSVTEPQAPDSAAVDVPDSVRANFSSFNISFIDPTVSAPTSATTEPNVASSRVVLITEEARNRDKDETLRAEAAVKEVESSVTEFEHEKVEDQMGELAATSEGFVATIDEGREPGEAVVVLKPLAAVLKEEEIVVEKQIEIKTEEAKGFSVRDVASANNDKETGTMKTLEEAEKKSFTEAKEPIAAVAETVAASEETSAAVSTIEKSDESTNESNVAQLDDEDKSAELIVVKVAGSEKEESLLDQCVVEKAADSVVENVVEPVKEKKISEPVEDENKASKVVTEKMIAKDVVQKAAESGVDVQSVDSVKVKTDDESVQPAGVTTFGEVTVSSEESDVVDKVIAVVKEPAFVIEEPVVVAITNQTEVVAETRPSGENKSDGSLTSMDGIESENLASISDNKKAAELKTTSTKESAVSN